MTKNHIQNIIYSMYKVSFHICKALGYSQKHYTQVSVRVEK